MIARTLALVVLAAPAVAQCFDQRLGSPQPTPLMFGRAVAAHDGTLAVGEWTADGGAVQVFTRGSAGYVWRQTLVGSSVDSGNTFGAALACDGDTLVVGDGGENLQRGAVTVYERGANGWTEVEVLRPPTGWPGAHFGATLALDGDLLAVGNYGTGGGVVVHRRVAGTWGVEATLLPTDTNPWSEFGSAVAVDGERVLVGDPGWEMWAGQAYLFRPVGGVWRQTQRFFDSSPLPQRRGARVALAGTLAAISAPATSEPGMSPDPGAVHVFRRSPGTWTEEVALIAADGAIVGAGTPWGFDSFGWALATDGKRVLVGAPILGVGRTYVYTREQGTWGERRRMVPPDATGSDNASSVLALDGEWAFSSAPFAPATGGAVWTIDLADPAGVEATCAALPNSTGVPAELDTRRSISIARNDLRLRASDLPAGETAVFFYGPLPRQVPLGDGFLCVAGGQFRLPPEQASNAGFASRVLDFGAAPMNAGPGAISAGSTWHFQCWYRDPGGVSGSNLTGGLRITFCP